MAEEKEATEKKPSAKRVRTVDKWKKKRWFQLIAPAEFDKKAIGETVAEKEKNIVGRGVEVNLGDLTGQRQRRHITVRFKVVDVQGNQANTVIVGHKISYGFLNRLVRRRISKIESNQEVTTADGKKVKVKSIALSMRKLAGKQETAIRNEMVEKIGKSCRKKNFSQLEQEFVFGVTASKLFKHLKDIAPLKRVEIVKSMLAEGN